MNLKNELLVVGGALVGGLIGLIAFRWLIGQGFYALLLPGGFVGLGAGMFKTPSKGTAVGCGCLALLFGLIAEWNSFPFEADGSPVYFLTHFYDLKPMTLILIGIGTAIGFWIPFRRGQEK